MSAEKLAFLQNFYTDVTLYMPVEPPPAAEAPPAREEKPASAPAKVVRDVGVPSKSYSHPSAGLERLAAGFNLPALAPKSLPEPLEQAPAPPAVLSPALPPAQPPVPYSEPAVPPVMLTRFTTMGENAQGVVVLFRLPQEQFVKLHRNVFLNKMLQALGFVMADVVLVNVEADLPVALVNLRRELAATHIIAFGKNLLDSTIRNTQIYEPVLFPSLNLSYMASATVDLVEYDVSLKKRLWSGLQRMFGTAG